MLEAPKIPAFLQQAADSNLKKGRFFRMILTTVWPIFFARALVLLIVKVYLNQATFPKVSKYLFQCLFSSFLSIFNHHFRGLDIFVCIGLQPGAKQTRPPSQIVIHWDGK